MASVNQAVTLFDNQTSDTTGSAFELTPRIKDDSRLYAIVLSGGIGGGTFSLEVSYDGTTFVDWLLDGAVFQQTIIGYDKNINIKIPLQVKGKLDGSTSPTLTAKLFFRHSVKDR